MAVMTKSSVAVLLMLAMINTATAHAADDAKLVRVKVRFITHDDNKDHDTTLDVHVKNKKTLFLSQDLADGINLGPNQEFKDKPPSTHEFELVLKSKNVNLKDVSLPIYNIHIQPNGNDRWIFDVTVTLEFDDGSSFSSTKRGIILDQDNKDYSGVFESN